MEAGKHGFDGAWADRGMTYIHNVTFSYGVFEWLPKSGGKGLKKSAVKVRVSGPTHKADAVKAKAEEIVALLDAGEYTGPKNVRVK